jgi:hypothetical protein
MCVQHERIRREHLFFILTSSVFSLLALHYEKLVYLNFAQTSDRFASPGRACEKDDDAP